MKKILLIILLILLILTLVAIKPFQAEETYYKQIQDLQIEGIIQDFNEKPVTFTDAKIVLNPLDTNMLSAYLMFETDSPLTYSYVVQGKNDNAGFNYSNDEPKDGIIMIPIIGLYANYLNTVDVIIENSDGGTQKESFEIDTTTLEIPEEYQKATVKGNDDFNKFMSNEWLINSESMAYDINGDLRVYGLIDQHESYMNFVKLVNGKFFIGSNDLDGKYYTPTYYQVDMMGRIKGEIVAPEGIGFHHDMTYDGQNYYVLGNEYDNEYEESLIIVYDSNYNYKKTIDLGEFFTGEESVLANSHIDDIHFNSINYLEQENQLILSSRSTSDIYAYDLDTEKFEWIVGEEAKENNEEFKDLYLTMQNPTEESYTSGNHSAFIINGDRVKDYEEGVYQLAIYDNRSCETEDKVNVENKLNEENTAGTILETNSQYCYLHKAAGKVYEINLNDRTVELIDKVELSSRNSYVSNFNQHGEYFVLGSPLNQHLDVVNNELEIIGSIDFPKVESGESYDTYYRANVISMDEINNL